MDGYHPKNKDPRPKRRKGRDNPYTIFTTGIQSNSPHYWLSFTDNHGERHSLEIGRELFDALDQFELDDLSVMNEIDNHYEHSDLTEESLNTRTANPPKSLEDTVFTRLQYERLHSAVSELPEIQRRRVNLYYFGGYTFEQIALLENCTKRAVKRSVDLAVDTLRENLKNFSD